MMRGVVPTLRFTTHAPCGQGCRGTGSRHARMDGGLRGGQPNADPTRESSQCSELRWPPPQQQQQQRLPFSHPRFSGVCGSDSESTFLEIHQRDRCACGATPQDLLQLVSRLHQVGTHPAGGSPASPLGRGTAPVRRFTRERTWWMRGMSLNLELRKVSSPSMKRPSSESGDGRSETAQ